MSNVVIGRDMNDELIAVAPYQDDVDQSADIVQRVRDVLKHEGTDSGVDYVIVSRDNGGTVTQYKLEEQYPTDGLLHDLVDELRAYTNTPHQASWQVVQTLRELGIIDPEVA